MTHTPGPWTKRNRSIVQIWSASGGIAQVYSQKEQAANARLIAAAPELLAEAEQQIDLMSGLVDFFEEGTHEWRVMEQRLRILKATVARARGDA